MKKRYTNLRVAANSVVSYHLRKIQRVDILVTNRLHFELGDPMVIVSVQVVSRRPFHDDKYIVFHVFATRGRMRR